jgi:hypothetical protein
MKIEFQAAANSAAGWMKGESSNLNDHAGSILAAGLQMMRKKPLNGRTAAPFKEMINQNELG